MWKPDHYNNKAFWSSNSKTRRIYRKWSPFAVITASTLSAIFSTSIQSVFMIFYAHSAKISGPFVSTLLLKIWLNYFQSCSIKARSLCRLSEFLHTKVIKPRFDKAGFSSHTRKEESLPQTVSTRCAPLSNMFCILKFHWIHPNSVT